MSIVYSVQMSRVDDLTLSTHAYHLTGGAASSACTMHKKGFNSIETSEEVSGDTYILCTNDTCTWERYWLWLDHL